MRASQNYGGFTILLVALMVLQAPYSSRGQDTASEMTRESTPVVIGERFTIRSEILGEDRDLLVATPDGYGSDEDVRYPVLYLLDGAAHFHHATGVVDFLADNGRMPRAIVVGIPNPSQDARTRDLTPEHRSEFLRSGQRADSLLPTAGGADDFLRFLRDELIPMVDREYRTTPFRILVGHSFGGLFNIHALTRDPEAFQAHIAISPSLWWDERRLGSQADSVFSALQARIAATTETDSSDGADGRSSDDPPLDPAFGSGFLYMTMGNEGGAMLRGAWELAGVLEEKAPENLAWHFELMDKETHGSVPHRSLYDGLEWLYEDWVLLAQNTLDWPADERLSRIDEHFDKVSELYRTETRTPEQFLNTLGYMLLGTGRAEEAIAIFEENVNRYPESPNVYDSLGDGYDAIGQLESALENYREAVRRAEAVGDSRLDNFRANLERLKEKIGVK